MLTTFDTGGPQRDFITSVTIAVGFKHFQCIRLS